jgi:hypothetical protein
MDEAGELGDIANQRPETLEKGSHLLFWAEPK